MKKKKYPKLHFWKHKQNKKHAMQSHTCAGVIAHRDNLLLAKLSIVGTWIAEAKSSTKLSTAGIWRTRAKTTAEVIGALEASSRECQGPCRL